MKELISRAKQNLQIKKRVSQVSEWLLGPVIIVNLISLTMVINLSDLSQHYRETGFWEATGKTIMVVLEAIGIKVIL
ncbi:hypothetical protein [Pleionea sediminis]|uniref:hypothetical protein n=1 Tax=Pleionea sediminis TaxID=2569479 RepID=UPI001186A255|nr:hypothetical protein [Pleionea sediminis]